MKKDPTALYPVKFPEANRVLTKPQDMTDEECGSLVVHTDGYSCVSCWKVPLWRRIVLLFTGKIWLGVVSGYTQPPVWLLTSRPFEDG